MESLNPPNCMKAEEYSEVGVVNFPFDKLKESFDGSSEEKGLCLTLLQRLWPGNWNDQLKNLNEEIRKRNMSARKNIREVSEHEFWRFIGVLIAELLNHFTPPYHPRHFSKYRFWSPGIRYHI